MRRGMVGEDDKTLVTLMCEGGYLSALNISRQGAEFEDSEELKKKKKSLCDQPLTPIK